LSLERDKQGLYKIFIPDVIDGLEYIELGFEKATRERRKTDTDARSSTEYGICGGASLSEDAKKKVMFVWVSIYSALRRLE